MLMVVLNEPLDKFGHNLILNISSNKILNLFSFRNFFDTQEKKGFLSI